MKLTVLSEAKAMPGFGAEHGLSFLLEVSGKKILFDAGASGLFLQNAVRMDLDLNKVDQVVLSHGHWDHGNGLKHLSGLPLLCHPDCFTERFRKGRKENIGLELGKHELEKRFNLFCSREPVQLTSNLSFLGEIPRENNFEARSSPFVLAGEGEDFIMDDSGLAYVGEKGLVVISGCAHSGICNMTEYARYVTGTSKVHAVIGGFHLKKVDQQTINTIEYFKKLGADSILPSHCTMGEAMNLFNKSFGANEVMAGQTLYF